MEIPVSDDFSFINVLADPFEIRLWNADGLPTDDVSNLNLEIMVLWNLHLFHKVTHIPKRAYDTDVGMAVCSVPK